MMEPPKNEFAGKKIYTPEERDEVVALSKTGHGNLEIARMTGIHGHVVNSLVNIARRKGELPPSPPKEPIMAPWIGIATKTPGTGAQALQKPSSTPTHAAPPLRPAYSVPRRIMHRSVLNRMGEVRQTVESIIKRLKAKNMDVAMVRGEVYFLKTLANEVERVLGQFE